MGFVQRRIGTETGTAVATKIGTESVVTAIESDRSPPGDRGQILGKEGDVTGLVLARQNQSGA